MVDVDDLRHRWSTREDGKVCMGEHPKMADCDWIDRETAEALVKARGARESAHAPEAAQVEATELTAALNVVLEFTNRRTLGKLPGLIAEALLLAAETDLEAQRPRSEPVEFPLSPEFADCIVLDTDGLEQAARNIESYLTARLVDENAKLYAREVIAAARRDIATRRLLEAEGSPLSLIAAHLERNEPLCESPECVGCPKVRVAIGALARQVGRASRDPKSAPPLEAIATLKRILECGSCDGRGRRFVEREHDSAQEVPCSRCEGKGGFGTAALSELESFMKAVSR
jgi:hypothetical protein